VLPKEKERDRERERKVTTDHFLKTITSWVNKLIIIL
jgi:hypothetical protein